MTDHRGAVRVAASAQDPVRYSASRVPSRRFISIQVLTKVAQRRIPCAQRKRQRHFDHARCGTTTDHLGYSSVSTEPRSAGSDDRIEPRLSVSGFMRHVERLQRQLRQPRLQQPLVVRQRRHARSSGPSPARIESHVSNRLRRWSLTMKASVSSRYGSENVARRREQRRHRDAADADVACPPLATASNERRLGPSSENSSLHADVAGEQVRELDVEAHQFLPCRCGTRTAAAAGRSRPAAFRARGRARAPAPSAAARCRRPLDDARGSCSSSVGHAVDELLRP